MRHVTWGYKPAPILDAYKKPTFCDYCGKAREIQCGICERCYWTSRDLQLAHGLG